MKARLVIAAIVAVLLAAFFGFVGFSKAFASIAELTRYGAWTIWLPEIAGRAVGWIEMACAVGLVGAISARTRLLARVFAIILIVNQLAAAAIHAAHGVTGALPQNFIIIALLGLAAVLLKSSIKGDAS